MRPGYLGDAPDHTFAPVALVRDVLRDVAGQLRVVSVARSYPCHAMWSAAKTMTRRLVAMARCSDRTSAVIDGCDRMTVLSVQAR
jgi:hypothetical protein